MEWELAMSGKLSYETAKQLSEDGMLVVVITISKGDRKIIQGPDTITRGFVYARESDDLLKEINQLVKKTIIDLTS